jgi:hypothetical protein
MQTLVKGTSVELIKKWILAMEQDIKKNNFYCRKGYKDFIIPTPLNKARLLILYDIFSLKYINDNHETKGGIRIINSPEYIKEAEREMITYFKTIKALLEIDTKGKK